MKLNEATKKAIISVLAALVGLAAAILGITSCNVTRVITTESSSIQRDDTSIIIQSKTIESYNATKNK